MHRDQLDQRVDAYLSKVIPRLEEDGFVMVYDLTWRSYDFNCVALSRRSGVEYLGHIGFSFFFSAFQTLDMHALRQFSLGCFDYAKRLRRVPLPYGFGERVACFPVALIDGADVALAELVRRTDPVKHWGNFLIPVVVDVASGELHLSHTNPLRGRLYLDHFKGIIRDKLGSSHSRGAGTTE